MCYVGRAYDPGHRTCRSCETQGARTCATRKRPRRAQAALGTITEAGVLVVYRDLRTPNAWTNKDRGNLIYRAERKAWERACAPLPHVLGIATGRRLLRVVRVVPDQRHLIRDETNRQGALKPLEDALVRLGVLLDDADEFLTRELVQVIDRDRPRVEIRVEDT